MVCLCVTFFALATVWLLANSMIGAILGKAVQEGIMSGTDTSMHNQGNLYAREEWRSEKQLFRVGGGDPVRSAFTM